MDMRSVAELFLLLVVLTDFAVLGTSRLSACIRAIALQGFLLGSLPLLVEGAWSMHAAALGLGTIAVKAILLPSFLRWAIREASVRREVEPLVGYMASLLLGALALGVAFAIASRLPQIGDTALLVPVALMTLIIGLVVLITRAKAVSQVVGYLMLENGIYLFGLTQTRRVPFLLEAGVLLDVFVAVFVMGIVVFHINREFDSISATNLAELRER
jgi:hydrogenase-4 component E